MKINLNDISNLLLLKKLINIIKAIKKKFIYKR